VSSSDFRQIAAKTETGRSERLFRAAVSAFCSLTRPTRNEISQLEDLVMPLFDSVSKDSLRYVAAALSETDFAPAALVNKLADQPLHIAAPLLLRSKVLTDVELIALVGRHGILHARVIAKRDGLNPVIADLIRALTASAEREAKPERKPVAVVEPEGAVDDEPLEVLELRQLFALAAMAEENQETTVQTHTPAANDPVPASPAPARSFGKAEAVREQLRAMMLPPDRPEEFNAVLELPPLLTPAALKRLRDTALTGHPAFFETALADALHIDYAQARLICGATGYADLLHALKSLDVPEDSAFLIVAANYPTAFGHAEAIRLFLERYHLCHPEAAREKARGWKTESIATAVRRVRPTAPTLDVANSDERKEIRQAS